VSALGFLWVSVVLQGAAMVLHKQRVAALAGGVRLGSIIRHPGRFFAPLARDPLWLLGWLLTVAGALAGLQALSAVDLTLAQALGKLQLLVVVGAGVVLLGERLGTLEWLALAVMASAALGLALGTPHDTGVVVATRTSLSFAGAALALLVPLWLALRMRPGGGELAHGVAAGVLFGCGDLLVKAATGQVREATGDFHALASLAALAGTAELVVALLCYGAGLVVVQGSFSIGRVSVVGPVVALAGSLLPISFGFAVLGESANPARALGLAGMLAAAALLSRRPPDPPRVSAGSARRRGCRASSPPGTCRSRATGRS
jgi:drug/metabolite transporter (DMT)-like permease